MHIITSILGLQGTKMSTDKVQCKCFCSVLAWCSHSLFKSVMFWDRTVSNHSGCFMLLHESGPFILFMLLHESGPFKTIIYKAPAQLAKAAYMSPGC